jgi:hypothetical protein
VPIAHREPRISAQPLGQRFDLPQAGSASFHKMDEMSDMALLFIARRSLKPLESVSKKDGPPLSSLPLTVRLKLANPSVGHRPAASRLPLKSRRNSRIPIRRRHDPSIHHRHHPKIRCHRDLAIHRRHESKRP